MSHSSYKFILKNVHNVDIHHLKVCLSMSSVFNGDFEKWTVII